MVEHGHTELPQYVKARIYAPLTFEPPVNSFKALLGASH
jgi:hypothetical protein